MQLTGRRRRLRGDLLHYSYRDVEHHIEKINDLTTLAAEKMFARGRRVGWFAMAFIPILQFQRMYFLKRGFLDGFAGLVVSILHAWYVFLQYAKLWELNKAGPDSSTRGAVSHSEPVAGRSH